MSGVIGGIKGGGAGSTGPIWALTFQCKKKMATVDFALKLEFTGHLRGKILNLPLSVVVMSHLIENDQVSKCLLTKLTYAQISEISKKSDSSTVI